MAVVAEQFAQRALAASLYGVPEGGCRKRYLPWLLRYLQGAYTHGFGRPMLVFHPRELCVAPETETGETETTHS
jgi:hypothetical protein